MAEQPAPSARPLGGTATAEPETSVAEAQPEQLPPPPETAAAGRKPPRFRIRVGSIRFLPALFFVYVIATLVVLTVMVPPFQKSDEPAHYYRAISLTNLDFICAPDDQGNYTVQLDRRYVDLPDLLHVWDIWIIKDAKFNNDWFDVNWSDPKFNEQIRLADYCNLPAPGYLPTAAGLAIGRPFENPLIGFYLGRIFGALFFVAAFIYALSITPSKYRLLQFLYAGSPTVLHQVSAISYDPVQLALFPVIFGLLTKFAVENKPIKTSELVIFLVALVWAVNIRLFTYTPLLLLFFAVRPSNIALDRLRYIKIAGGFTAVALVITTALNLLHLPRITNTNGASTIDAHKQIDFILAHPGDFIEAMYKTVSEGEWILKQGLSVFGWTDTPLAYFPYYAIAFVAGIVIYRTFEKDELHLRWYQIAAVLAPVVFTTILLFVSLYAVWTPVGEDSVFGLQGRYFVGLVPIAVFGLSQLACRVGKKVFLQGLLLVATLIFFFNIVRTVDLRYYE